MSASENLHARKQDEKVKEEKSLTIPVPVVVEEDHHHSDIENNESKTTPAVSLPMIRFSSPQVMIYVYTATFFGAMIGMEVAMEAASDAFSDLRALGSAITFFQMSWCVLFPLAISKGKGLENFPRTKQDLLPYIKLSLLVFGATGLANEAILYVTYPTGVVIKSAKLIPTMVVATVWQGQGYTRLEYLAALLLCAGAAGYSYGSGNDHDADATIAPFSANAAWGVALLLVSIVCDAVVPNYQKILLNQGVPVAQLMINCNDVGTLGVVAYMIVTGQLFAVIRTCYNHPQLFMYLTFVGIGLSTAVWAYTKLIQATSSVMAVTVSTLRKVATMFLSCIIFPKPLLTIHIYSGCLVLLGLVLSSVAKEKLGKTKVELDDESESENCCWCGISSNVNVGQVVHRRERTGDRK
ncbi:Adenosine 3'-phospho 5'-phosphosulfate transporter 2 [Seminavis robusta]|uniref:Adenosine 3'-phospho 5'-phosphosulfate transporter 2 n=1 Tax=Seminavis robusta TaxID=568900 RepID=A0A9N8HVV8_9STRA|nr:Adenosine 3'-phospho 5'-phosphosulfate transporter 2 [Seminavis robusta]|eukprot:Sro2013_g310980.1 Adenosine 3'-phospho 5'-phosphosulfate transporter 2 (410) ;mRNA; r:13006-14235